MEEVLQSFVLLIFIVSVSNVQFFYEPGTNKQFRSMKSVEKYLESKGQKINPITPKVMQGNEQQKNEMTPLASIPFEISNVSMHANLNSITLGFLILLCFICVCQQANSKSPNLESNNKNKNKNKDKNKKKISREKAIANLNFNFKEAPKEVTWVLSDAKNDKWTSFMGHLNVQESVEKYWYEAFKVINSMNEKDPENSEDDKNDDAASDDDDDHK